MNTKHNMSAIAACATLLATLPFTTIYASISWGSQATVMIAGVTLAGVAARAARAPVWGQLLALLAGFLLMLTWMFHSGHELLGLVPTESTVRHFVALIREGTQEMQAFGLPAPERPGLFFLTAILIGLVAVAVDFIAVSLRQPAAAGIAMLPPYLLAVAIHSHSVPFLAFVFAGAGFLWLLVADNVDRVRSFGRRFTGTGRSVERWDPSPLARAGRRIAAAGVVVAILLPGLAPGLGTALINDFYGTNGLGIGNGNGTGPGPTVNLFALLAGDLRLTKPYTMVRVTTDDPAPFYLRFGVADQVGDSGFTSQQPTGGAPVTVGLPSVGPFDNVLTLHYQASVRVVNLNAEALPVYSQPTAIHGVDSRWVYDPPSNLVYSNRQTTQGLRYSFDYDHLWYTPDALRTSQPIDPASAIAIADTAVPSVGYVSHLVAGLTAGQPTVYDKVLAIYQLFSPANGFEYNLSTKPGSSPDDIVNFLTNKQGFCVQYAAAMAWLVRAAGIPARVAFGFTRGNNPISTNGTYTLTTRDLHAWTEVYFDGFGWVPFDATPSGQLGGVTTLWAPDMSPSNLGASGSANPGATGIEASNAPHGLPGQQHDVNGGGLAALRDAPARLGWRGWTTIGLLVALLLAATPSLGRLRLRRQRLASVTGARSRRRTGQASPPDRRVGPGGRPIGGLTVVPDDLAARAHTHAVWDELLDSLVDHGIPTDVAETPRSTAERIVRDLHLVLEPADGARHLGRSEEYARYAPTTLPTGELAGWLRSVREALTQSASTRIRLRARFLPPSVVNRWRAQLIDTLTIVVTTVGGWRDRLVRALNPGRLLSRSDPS